MRGSLGRKGFGFSPAVFGVAAASFIQKHKQKQKKTRSRQRAPDNQAVVLAGHGEEPGELSPPDGMAF